MGSRRDVTFCDAKYGDDANRLTSITNIFSLIDDNFNHDWQFPGNGVLMADGWITASYNALNQPVAMWSFAYQGTPNFMWFGYDPLAVA